MSKHVQEPAYLNVQEAAALLGVSPKTIRKWASSGKLKGAKVGRGREWRFVREDLTDTPSLDKNKDNNEGEDEGESEEGSRTEPILTFSQLEAVFKAVPGLYLVVKADAPRFSIVAVSDAYTHSTLTRRENISGKPLFEVFSDNPEDPTATGNTRLAASLNTVIKTRQSHTMPTQKHDIAKPDGSFEERFWDVVNTPVFDDKKNEVSFIVHAASDVTLTIKLAEREKQAREEQEAQRQQFYELIMHAPAFIAVISGPDLRFEIANPLYQQLVGADRNLDGRPLLEAFPDLDPQLLNIVRNVAFRGERFVANELPIFLDWDFSGEPYTKFVNLIYEPILDAQDKSNGLICFGFDVSEQVKARQKVEDLVDQIEQQAQRFDTILTNVKDFIYTFDKAGRFTYSNISLLNLLGLTLEQILGKTFHELPYPQKLATTLQTQIAIVVETAKPVVAETAYTNPAGVAGYYEYIFVPILNQEGQVEAVAGSTRDITERKQTEAALRRSQIQFQALTDANIVGVVHCDLAGNVREANTAFLTMLGYTKKEVEARQLNLAALTPPQHQAWDEKAHQELLKSGVARPWEKEFIRKNGNLVPVIIGVAQVNIETEECVAIVLDITERKRLEERKDEFINIASHELKTPLATLKGYNQLLARLLANQDDEKIKAYLAKTTTYIERLNSLISDLLDVSKIQAGKIDFNISEFDFDELVRDGVESIEPTTTSHKIEIVGAAKTRVKADRNRLEQVFTNLLTNAIKYSPHSDRVVVSVRKVSTLTQQAVEVAVQDFGIGIVPETQSKIFERYYREANVANEFSGLGLGLYISSEIIKRLGGELKVDSEEGKGSTFTFTVPIKQDRVGP